MKELLGCDDSSLAEKESKVGHHRWVTSIAIWVWEGLEMLILLERRLSSGLSGGCKAGHEDRGGRRTGSGANLLYCMDINAKFDFIDQQANNNIVHLF